MDPCAKPSKVYDLLCSYYDAECVDLLKRMAINEIRPTLDDYTLVVNDDNYLREMMDRFPSLSLSVLTASRIERPEDLMGRDRLFVNLKRGTVYSKVCLANNANNSEQDDKDIKVVYREVSVCDLYCPEDYSRDDDEEDSEFNDENPEKAKDLTCGHYDRSFTEFKDKFLVMVTPNSPDMYASTKDVRARLLEITAPTVCPNCMNSLDKAKNIIRGVRREAYNRDKRPTRPERYAATYQCPVCLTLISHAAPRLGPEHFTN